MRIRQPPMQGDDTGFGAKTECCQQECSRCPEWFDTCFPHNSKFKRAGSRIQGGKRAQDQQPCHMRHEQIDKSRLAVLQMLMLMGNEEIGRYTHQFPEQHKGQCIPGQHHPHHTERKQRHKDQQRCDPFFMAKIAMRIDGDRKQQRTDHQQEKCTQCIQLGMQRQPGQTKRQGDAAPARNQAAKAGGNRQYPGHGQQQTQRCTLHDLSPQNQRTACCQ